MGLGATLAGAANAGLASAITGGIGSIISGGLGLLGGLFKKNNNGLKNQQKLMQQAWEYEKKEWGYNTTMGNRRQTPNMNEIYKCGKLPILEHKGMKWKKQD